MPSPIAWNRLLPVFLLGSALILGACGDSGPTAPGEPGAPPVAAIRVLPDAPELVIGGSLRLVATPLSAGGRELTGRALAWASADTSKASVAADGTVTARAEGDVTLTVSSEGVRRLITLRVVPVRAAFLVLEPAALTLLEGEVETIAAEVQDSLGRPLAGRVVTWSVDDEAIATVDEAGVVTARRWGRAVVTARHGASLEATLDVEVTETVPADLLFHSVDVVLGLPRVFRVDPRDPNAPPVEWFASAGAWQVAVSPDGQRIAFTCKDLGPAICVSDRTGMDVRMLTGSDLYYEDHPTWSPDGARIAFRRWLQGGTPGQVAVTDIWVMDADGSAQTNLTNDDAMQHDPAWSPVLGDGTTRIVYMQTELLGGYLTSRLFSIRDDGASRRAESPQDGRLALDPAWSPDGSRIVYVKDGLDVFGDLWVTQVGTAQEGPLLATPLDGEQRAPAFSPDGRHIAFTSMHELTQGTMYRSQIYTVRSDGTDLVRRTTDAADKHDPAWLVR